MWFERQVLPGVVTLLLLGGCDQKSEGQPEAQSAAATSTELTQGATAASLRLDAIVELVSGDEIADAKALEDKINDPEAGLAAVDVDGDGETDYIEVVEAKVNGKAVLALRAIPSSKQDQKPAKVGVVVAKVEIYVESEQTIVVDATYTEHIEHDATIHVYHHERPAVYEGGVLVVAPGCFFHYALVLEHEVYLGHHHVVVIDDHHPHHHFKHKKHKHKKHKGHKGHKGHGHGHGVVVTW